MIGQWVVSYLEQKRTRVVARAVRGRLLDVGCGHNLLVKLLGQGVGVDVYPWEGIDTVIDDAARLPFDDSSFDTVTFVACLNHIPNREAALREAVRVVTRDGQVLVTMIGPTISRVWHRLMLKYDRDQTERGMKDGEVWGLTGQEISRMAAAAGLRVRKVVPFEFGLNRLYVLERNWRDSGGDC